MADENTPTNEVLPDNVFLVMDAHLFPVQKKLITIGRNIGNDLIITDPRVSRYHARIEYEDHKFYVVDLDSTYGTFVNNDRVGRREIKSGDTVSLASTPLLFIDRSEALLQRGTLHTGTLEDLDEEDR